MSRRFHRRPASHTALVAGLTLAIVGSAGAQRAPGEQGSSNFQVLGHIPLGRSFSSSDLEIESEVARPFVYTSRMLVHGVQHHQRQRSRKPDDVVRLADREPGSARRDGRDGQQILSSCATGITTYRAFSSDAADPTRTWGPSCTT